MTVGGLITRAEAGFHHNPQRDVDPSPRSSDGPSGRTDADARGDADFSSVYEENVFQVYGFIGYRVRSRHVTEDLTQIVFEKALRAWSRFDPSRSSASTWLLSIAKNVLIDHFRRHKDALMEEDVIVGLIEQSGRSQDTGQDADLSAELAEALSALNPREQTVLALRFGGDLTGPEIARVLGLSTDNVHQILSRSLRRLRSSLGADELRQRR